MAFHDMIIPTAVTEEVVNEVKLHYGLDSTKAALFMLGFRLDANLTTYKHMVRNPLRPYELYETFVHHGILRNEIKFQRDGNGNSIPVKNKQGHIQFTSQPHRLQRAYEAYEVIGMEIVNKDFINVLDHGNDYIG